MSKDTQLQIRCSDAWKARLRAAATEEEREMADLIREAVNEYLDRRDRRRRRLATSDQ